MNIDSYESEFMIVHNEIFEEMEADTITGRIVIDLTK